MNKIFSAVAASFVAFSTFSVASHAQSNSISNPFWKGDEYCQFTIPDELDVLEAQSRYEEGERIDPRLSSFFGGVISNLDTHHDLWFERQGTPQVLVGDGYIQIYVDISDLAGEERIINRLEREDEPLTIMDSLFSGAIIHLDTNSGDLTVTLSDGRSQMKSFSEIDAHYKGEDRSVVRFNKFDVIAYPSPGSSNKTVFIDVHEPAEHKGANALVREGIIINLKDGFVSADLYSHINYDDPLLETSVEFANLLPPMMVCHSALHRTSITSLVPDVSAEQEVPRIQLDLQEPN